MQQIQNLEPEIQKRVDEWLNPPYDEKTRAEVQDLVKKGPGAVRDAFYSSLSFGTGGLRGIMGPGTTRLNVYTIRIATQGLANYILKQTKGKNPSVFIGFDSRHNSTLFAQETAQVLAGNGIKVYLLKNLRPTPFISFGCRTKHCTAAVMITASHNPAIYNGYKVYWSDGGQVVAPHDQGIMQEVNAVGGQADVKRSALNDPLIEIIDVELDAPYLAAIQPLQLYPEENKKEGKNLKIVFTSLHGTGITLAPKALAEWGFANISYVEEQIKIDGDFPTVKVPNPEYKETLQMGMDTLQKTNSDLLLATDPDADRMGVVVLHHGKPVILNGNEVASLCVAHISETLSKRGGIPPKGAFVTTIVSTDLVPTIAHAYHATCVEVLTGFKYIGEKIFLWETEKNGYQFLFGAEESYGYLIGTHSRDKDAIVSCCLMSEIALLAKLQKITLVDRLYDLYRKYGVFREKQLSVDFNPGKEGMDQMVSLMSKLRKNPPNAFLGKKVQVLEDYKDDKRTFVDTGKTEKLALPKSDVLLFRLEDETKIVIRPSGTEPKIKVYAGVRQKTFSSVEEGISQCDAKLDQLLSSIKKDLFS